MSVEQINPVWKMCTSLSSSWGWNMLKRLWSLVVRRVFKPRFGAALQGLNPLAFLSWQTGGKNSGDATSVPLQRDAGRKWSSGGDGQHPWARRRRSNRFRPGAEPFPRSSWQRIIRDLLPVSGPQRCADLVKGSVLGVSSKCQQNVRTSCVWGARSRT